VQDFALNFGDNDNALFHTSHVIKEFLTKNNMTVIPHPPHFSLFPHYFDTIERITTESQAVLKTLTKHSFQDAFKKWQKRRELCICAE
jgi:hypothetical protein